MDPTNYSKIIEEYKSRIEYLENLVWEKERLISKYELEQYENNQLSSKGNKSSQRFHWASAKQPLEIKLAKEIPSFWNAVCQTSAPPSAVDIIFNSVKLQFGNIALNVSDFQVDKIIHQILHVLRTELDTNPKTSVAAGISDLKVQQSAETLTDSVNMIDDNTKCSENLPASIVENNTVHIKTASKPHGRPRRATATPKRYEGTIDYTKIPLKYLTESSKNAPKISRKSRSKTVTKNQDENKNGQKSCTDENVVSVEGTANATDECSVCDEKFESEELLTQHKWTEHMLHECVKISRKQRQAAMKQTRALAKPKISKQIKSKQKHGRNLKRRNGYYCLCGRKSYATLELLTKHIQYFTLEKRFKCCKCERRFVGANFLRQHYILAHGEKPGANPVFGCRSCGKMYKIYRELCKHRKEFHSNAAHN